MTRTRLETLALIRQIRRDPAIGKEWIDRYQRGDREAGSLLVRAHFPLIRLIAVRHSRPWYRDWEDCLQEGRLGCLRGCEAYDATRGSISTCLGVWIRSFISRFLMEKGTAVRIPVHRYERKAGRPAYTSIWKPRTKLFSDMVAGETWEEDSLSFEEVLVDERTLADECLSDAELADMLPAFAAWFLARCSPAQADILRRRFAEPPQTLKEIGAVYELSRERIRQIEELSLSQSVARATVAGFAPNKAPTFEHWLVKVAEVLFGRRATERSAA